MRVILRFAVLLMLAHSASSEPAPFQLMRFDENYNPNINPGQFGPPPEPYKYVPLTADGETYLSFGGEIRERYDVFDAPRFGIGSKSDAYDLQRLLLHGDLHVGRHFRIYAELGRHDVFDKRTTVLPVDKSPTNIQNLFIDVQPESAEHWRIRVGRQELFLNPTQRFIAVSEG
ncbi:MAG TPA: alginate export family protein, partial [Steroidobacteraceae bacterium]